MRGFGVLESGLAADEHGFPHLKTPQGGGQPHSGSGQPARLVCIDGPCQRSSGSKVEVRASSSIPVPYPFRALQRRCDIADFRNVRPMTATVLDVA
jgi:hypothetical protein